MANRANDRGLSLSLLLFFRVRVVVVSFFRRQKAITWQPQSKRRAMERRVGVVVAAFDSLEGCCCKATSKTRKSLHQEEENERGNQAEKNRSKKSAEVSATTRMRWTYSQACYEREGGVQRVVAG